MSSANIYPCHCGRSFTSTSALIQHRESYPQGPPHRCPYCHKPFTSISSLLQHQKTHNTASPNTNTSTKKPLAHTHLCHCNKSFSSAFALRQHQKASHKQQASEQPSWCCQQCGESFSSASSLKQHRETHKIEQKQKQKQKQKCLCSCGKRFKTADGMAHHQRTSKVHMEAVDNVTECEEEAQDSGVAVQQDLPEIGGVEYDRFSETALGSNTTTKGSLRPCPQLQKGLSRVPARTGGGKIGRIVEKMELPSDVEAGLRGLLDDNDDGNPEKQEERTAAVLSFWGGTGKDVTMCDEECGWCGECGDEYRP